MKNEENYWEELLNAKFDSISKSFNDKGNWYRLLGIVVIPLGELVRLNPNLLQ